MITDQLRSRIYGGTQKALWEQLWNLPGREIARLGHCRVGYAPYERRPAKIARYNNDGVCQRDRDEQVWRREICKIANPARGWPSEHDEPQCRRADRQTRISAA